MTISGSFELLPPEENIPLAGKDPSIPDFHFTEQEREEMKKKGKTEEQIDKSEQQIRERIIINRSKVA